MTSKRAEFTAEVLGVLSVACGCAMLLGPNTMARLFALPRSVTRWLGARDLMIGVGLLNPRWRRVSSIGRASADILDFSLIAGHALRSKSSVDAVRGRLLIAIASSLTGLYASTARHAPDSDAA